jgi:hypothetical protein
MAHSCVYRRKADSAVNLGASRRVRVAELQRGRTGIRMSEIILALSYRQDIAADLLGITKEKFTRDTNTIQSLITSRDRIANADIGRVFAYLTYSPDVVPEEDVLAWTATILSTNLYIVKGGAAHFPFNTGQAFTVLARKQG